MRRVFLSRIMWLSNEEKRKGIEGNSHVCGYVALSCLEEILWSKVAKTYFEHLIQPTDYIRLVIDYDGPLIPSITDLKLNLFGDFMYKFILYILSIRNHKMINKKDFYNSFFTRRAISVSDDNKSNRLHVVYPSVVLHISTLIDIMKKDFRILYPKTSIDYSIYRRNFNLRITNSIKHDGTRRLIPIINKNRLDHLATYSERPSSYCIIY